MGTGITTYGPGKSELLRKLEVTGKAVRTTAGLLRKRVEDARVLAQAKGMATELVQAVGLAAGDHEIVRRRLGGDAPERLHVFRCKAPVANH